MVSIGFVLSHEQFAPAHLIELGVRAEATGFDMVWTSDHFHPWMHNQGHAGQAWITLAALGQRMQRIPMGTGVTCPTYRYHPALVAQAFASLGALYPGRVFLGVGTGEAVNEQAVTSQWEPYEERAARLVEAVSLIRQLWTGQSVTFDGRYYQTVGAQLYTLPSQPVPLFIAAEGPKSMRLSGANGDGLISDSKTALMPDMRREFEAGAREAGKDPAAMPIHAESFVFVGPRQQAEGAAQVWRFLPKAWEVFVNNPDPRAILRQAEAEIPIDKVLDMWVISEDPQPHIEAIQELIDGGVTHVYIHSGQEDQAAVIDFYGRHVLPQFRHETMQPELTVADVRPVKFHVGGQVVFQDRADGGRLLAEKLLAYRDRPDVLVLALPRGGVPVAAEVASVLHAPLDVFLVRKLGAPGQEELALGAVATGGTRVLNTSLVQSLGVTPAELDAITAAEQDELRRREQAYRDHLPPPIRDHTVILVDDGLATGATMRAAIRAIRQYQPKRIVVGVPIAAPDVCDTFRDDVDDLVCAVTPEPFRAVGLWYQDFEQTTDDDVRGLLARARQASASQPAAPAPSERVRGGGEPGSSTR